MGKVFISTETSSKVVGNNTNDTVSGKLMVSKFWGGHYFGFSNFINV